MGEKGLLYKKVFTKSAFERSHHLIENTVLRLAYSAVQKTLV